MKKVIITADDLGINEATNLAVKESFDAGLLKSSCIMANGSAFDDAVEKVVKQCPGLDIGIHLDIIEGKALSVSGKSPLTDKEGKFNNSYIQMLLKSYDKEFLKTVETEFRSQINKAVNSGIKIVFINTHVHTHSIPAIFEITAKLAAEYGIPFIRTQAELPYYTKGIKRHLSFHYCSNIIKNVLMNFFSLINKKTAKKFNIKTNDYFLGVLYTGQMDEETIILGIKRLPDGAFAELICHPSVNPEKKSCYREYKALTSPELKEFFAENNADASKWG